MSEDSFEIDRTLVVLGAVAGTLWFAFTLALVVLLQYDQAVALAAAIGGSVLSGILVVVYFLYVYES